MADASIVVTEAGDDTPAVGKLFKGITFFLTARVPTRAKFIADIEASGGRVSKIDTTADYVITDHVRQPTPAGSFSYTLIEQAIRDGVFPNPADHALGPKTDSPRAVGSRVPGKRTRTAFTAEDDLALWNYVEQEKAQGELPKGNEIYKRLELANPRHTWQAWRDHYVKKLLHNPFYGALGRDDDASPMDDDEEPVVSQVDYDILWAQARDIDNMEKNMYEKAWDLWAQVNTSHTADEWRQIWESDVRPAYRKSRPKAKAKRRYASGSGGEEDDSARKKARRKGKKSVEAPDDADAEMMGEGAGAEAAQADDHGNLEEPDDDLAALETWQGASKRRSGSTNRLDGPDVQTSEANQAVAEQIQAEINGTTSTEQAIPSEPILTSDANRAADIQIQRSLASQVPQSVQTNSHIKLKNDIGGDGAQDDLHAWYADRVEELNGTNPTGVAVNGHALTEANLVTQQAEHTEPLIRGADLPKDDQNKDQSEYVKFLQNVTGQPKEAEPESEQELPSNAQPVRTAQAIQGAQEASNIPLSTQKKVDTVMKDAMDWPSSPHNKGDQMESQEEEFETQLPQPTLPVSKNHLRSLMPDFELSSQSIDESLPSQREYSAVNLISNRDTRTTQPDIFEGLDDINDTHIDLSIPEPEGDFTFTSSPERQQAAASAKKSVKQKSGKTAVSDKPAQKSGPTVVDISSDDASSSLPSSPEVAPSNSQAKRKHAVETQDILNAETQAPDFFLPPPDDTQGVGGGNSQMQDPDLSIPLPPDFGTAEVELTSSTKAPTKRQKGKQKAVESQTMDVERELESWLDTQQVRGFSEASAIEAMQRSSMRPDLAELVLLAEKGGLGLPSDVPGIWSEREDKVLESGDSGALRRLEAKHGWDECDARMRFLAEWREA